MTDKKKLFFELIRVAIGNAENLSHLPSCEEWKELYEIAKKQSLVGVCFAGLQRLGADAEGGSARIGMSEMLYLTWMGMAAKIQQRNEVVNQQCTELGKRLEAEGYRYCILKGQGAAALYGDLSALRQSGDIDVWVDAHRKEIIGMVQRIAPTTSVREHHLELKLFADTEVEVHYWPAVIRHFLKNRKLQKWFDSRREEIFANNATGDSASFASPTPEFHAIQMMAHMYHHLFDSGIGLRQVMDYYFVLQALAAGSSGLPIGANGARVSNELNGSSVANGSNAEIGKAIEKIGMGRFASAMMWVIAYIFEGKTSGISETIETLDIKPNEEDGKFLLGEIMRGGNFGHHDSRKNLRKGGYLNSFLGGNLRNLRYLRFNPFDWFWSPLWRLWYFGWRKLNGYD